MPGHCCCRCPRAAAQYLNMAYASPAAISAKAIVVFAPITDASCSTLIQLIACPFACYENARE